MLPVYVLIDHSSSIKEAERFALNNAVVQLFQDMSASLDAPDIWVSVCTFGQAPMILYPLIPLEQALPPNLHDGVGGSDLGLALGFVSTLASFPSQWSDDHPCRPCLVIFCDEECAVSDSSLRWSALRDQFSVVMLCSLRDSLLFDVGEDVVRMTVSTLRGGGFSSRLHWK